jgi:hypothetical protein
VLYHTGPAGNQSPRHVTRSNTFDEAQRLGGILATAVAKVVPSIEFQQQVRLECRREEVVLPLRTFPTEADAKLKAERAFARLRELREAGAARTDIRTAEVDWFGATETFTLSRAAAGGKLAAAAASCTPAEVQTLLVGRWVFIAFQGELFVEFGLELKSRIPKAFVISYANGELQGYLVTQQAVDEGGYESANAIFQSPLSGDLLVKKAIELLAAPGRHGFRCV